MFPPGVACDLVASKRNIMRAREWEWSETTICTTVWSRDMLTHFVLTTEDVTDQLDKNDNSRKLFLCKLTFEYALTCWDNCCCSFVIYLLSSYLPAVPRHPSAQRVWKWQSPSRPLPVMKNLAVWAKSKMLPYWRSFCFYWHSAMSCLVTPQKTHELSGKQHIVCIVLPPPTFEWFTGL